jgi:hypothetical protein
MRARCAATAVAPRIPGPRERHQEGVALGVDLLSVPFGKRLTEEAPVFRKDARIPAIAETLAPAAPPPAGRIRPAIIR